nr:flagellar biosynthetic protein FliO [Pseudohoeflea sp. DP4N28-3]
MEQFGGEQAISFALAVGAVAIGLLVLVIVLRLIRARSNSTFIRGGNNRKPRLAVLDAAAVDTRRRLVLVRRDRVEHLILIGGPTDVVIESGISIAAPGAHLAPTNGDGPLATRPSSGESLTARAQAMAQPARQPQPQPQPQTQPKQQPRPHTHERPAAHAQSADLAQSSERAEPLQPVFPPKMPAAATLEAWPDDEQTRSAPQQARPAPVPVQTSVQSAPQSVPQPEVEAEAKPSDSRWGDTPEPAPQPARAAAPTRDFLHPAAPTVQLRSHQFRQESAAAREAERQRANSAIAGQYAVLHNSSGAPAATKATDQRWQQPHPAPDAAQGFAPQAYPAPVQQAASQPHGMTQQDLDDRQLAEDFAASMAEAEAAQAHADQQGHSPASEQGRHAAQAPSTAEFASILERELAEEISQDGHEQQAARDQHQQYPAPVHYAQNSAPVQHAQTPQLAAVSGSQFSQVPATAERNLPNSRFDQSFPTADFTTVAPANDHRRDMSARPTPLRPNRAPERRSERPQDRLEEEMSRLLGDLARHS